MTNQNPVPPKASPSGSLTMPQYKELLPDTYKGDAVVYLTTIKDRLLGQKLTIRDMNLLLQVAKRSGLDPLTNQIYGVPRWSNSKNAFEMTIQTGIDGFRLIAQKSGAYAGQDDAVFTVEDLFNPITNEVEKSFKATVTVYKIVSSVKCAFPASARWHDYVPMKDGKPTGLWAKMPHGQLAKCAESLALRKAFPNDLSGLYTSEEMAQADNQVKDLPVSNFEPPVNNQPAPASKIQEDSVQEVEVTDSQPEVPQEPQETQEHPVMTNEQIEQIMNESNEQIPF